MERETINYLILIGCLVLIVAVGLGVRDVMNERIDDEPQSDILINYEAEIYGVEIHLSVTKEEK